jgi:Protein of unknown function (DUF1997)
MTIIIGIVNNHKQTDVVHAFVISPLIHNNIPTTAYDNKIIRNSNKSHKKKKESSDHYPINKRKQLQQQQLHNSLDDDENDRNNNNSGNINSIYNGIDQERRTVLLERKGPYWNYDRSKGNVEFGATAQLVTQLNENGGTESWNEIAEWITNSEMAMSIWDPNLTTPLGNDQYRLQVMKLQFVTITIQPTVDVLMKTDYYNGDKSKPIFIVQSTDFNPNIQLLPGLPSYDAASLGIVIEVSGRLVPSKNGKGVTGIIVFTTSGKLPTALRIIPERVLRSASDKINETVANFAIRSFEKGAREKYKSFQSIQQQQLQIQQQQQQQQQQ